ncbi:MAG: creatininase family protein [Ruminococcaceae bacterium]|nr:creatininase family protein [Oscillospiraceae bacterium]
MESFKLSADAIVAQDPELAILPVGSLEQHGPHLPIMTDWAIATELGRRVAGLTGGFLLPALPISTCREHMGKKGSVWMEPPTFYQMMNDIILSLKVQGFKRVVILQCHGGIFIMPPLVRDLNAKYNPDLMVVNIDACIFFDRLYKEGIYETNTELHAGEGETSMMLAIAPETVDMSKAVDEVPNIPRSYLSYGSIFRGSASGVWGESKCATAEKGEKALTRSAEMTVEEMEKAFAYMEAKKPFGYSNF